MKWKIWYADGSTFSDENGSHEEAPGVGVIGIAQPEKWTGTTVVRQFDWYYWNAEDGYWFGADIHGLMDKLVRDRKGHIRAIKMGEMIGWDAYEGIIRKAMTDPDMPPKTAKLKLEKPW